jgi:hypothetical protein
MEKIEILFFLKKVLEELRNYTVLILHCESEILNSTLFEISSLHSAYVMIYLMSLDWTPV